MIQSLFYFLVAYNMFKNKRSNKNTKTKEGNSNGPQYVIMFMVMMGTAFLFDSFIN